MKKIKLMTIILTVFFLAMPTAKAAVINTSASTVYPGQSFTASVTIYAAAWNVHSSVTGPVSGCIMNDANASDTALNISKTVTTTCTATGIGAITISLSGDYTTEDGNNVSLSGSTSVQVVQQPAPQPQPQTPSNPTPYTPPTPQVPKSTNNYLKSLVVEGCSISPTFNKDTMEYSCKDLLIDKIEIKAEVEDSKATLIGTGEKTLFNGDNNFEVNVTSESGQVRTYKLLINKKNIPSTKILKLTLGDKEYKIDDEIILFGLPKDTEKLDLKVTTDSTTAKVNITGNDNLKPGYNIINISVTDTDCKEKNYKVLVYVQEYDLLENKEVSSLDKDQIIYLPKNAAYLLNKSILNNVGTNKVYFNIIDNNYGVLASMEITSKQQLENDYELYFITKNNKVYTNIFENTNVKAYFGNKFKIGEKLYIYAYDDEKQTYRLINEQTYEDYYVSIKTENSFEYLITNKKISSKDIVEEKNSITEIIFVVLIQVIIIGVIVAITSIILKKKYNGNVSEDKVVQGISLVAEQPKIEEKTEKVKEQEKESTEEVL